ncbi:potassium/proton antiporter [Aeromicrobium sp. 636]|uniref:Potassium/proton antiporter n=1 Tax=Aeromicrobium senzhongii TaxID=2663859 RepID=A0A8I0EVS9_9ACTN|nr:potassium/proton antiporter [Aeromicrobium sp. 636]MBC9227084.1 potassium/proton antiporter [Aeromicrobium senzhongii]MCQ3999184.1 potassium/proton antiporter [Aeromicrobium sp. 636]
MSAHDLDVILLVGSGVLILAVLAVRLSVGVGLPSLLMYLGLGVLIGYDGAGVQFADANLALMLGLSALILILAEGGLTTNWSQMRPSLGLGVLLATVGTSLSVIIVAAGAHWIFGLEWELAVLIAAVLSPTDAAAVFSVLRSVPLKSRVSGVLEAESGLNDAPIVVLVTAISVGEIGHYGATGFFALVVYELVIGALLGLLVGAGGAKLLRRAALPAAGLYPLVVFAMTVLAYALAATIHASGFAAVYVAAVVLGNTELPHRSATRSFVEGIGWLAQIGLFVMLGLLVHPSDIQAWHIGAGVGIGALLTFVARPASVAACTAWFRVGWREQLFISWAGLRGAVPIVLATIPLANGVSHSIDLFNTTFVAVVVYTIIQAGPLGRLARWCGVETDRGREVEIDAAPLERVSADLLQIRVPPTSRLAGVEVGELRLPRGASVTMVVRDDSTFVPHRTTRILVGDDLLIVTTRDLREEVERRLRSVARHGRLAGWDQDPRTRRSD